jgi:ABC-type transporter Mla subunit MlaD
MDQRVMQFRMGVLALGAAMTAVILVSLFAGTFAPFHKANTFYVRLPSAPGLTAGSPVCKRGVRIGAVSKVELAADDCVLATVQIDANRPIYSDESCWLKSNLFGDAQLDFEPAGTAGSAPDESPKAQN